MSSRRSSRRLLLGLGVLLVLVASGCATDAPLDTLDPKGPEAQAIDNLLNPVLIIAGVVFLFVELGIIYLVVRFRRRKDDVIGAEDEELPAQVHGNLVMELGWTILPAALFANGWLLLKIGLLLGYIVLGSFALKRARGRRAKALCFVAALAVYAFRYGVARAHHPLGPLFILFG